MSPNLILLIKLPKVNAQFEGYEIVKILGSFMGLFVNYVQNLVIPYNDRIHRY